MAVHPGTCYIHRMPTFTARFDDPAFLSALDHLRGSPPGLAGDLSRAQPTRTEVIRRLVLAAAGAPDLAAPAPEPPRRVDLLPAFLDAWAALCVQLGRRCATSLEAVAAAPPGVQAALSELGHPEALRSPRSLGQALRHLANRRASDGRYLSSSRGIDGRSIWYVTGGA